MIRNENILDNISLEQEKYNRIMLIALSIFGWLFIAGSTYTIDIFLKDVFIITDVEPILNFGIRRIICVALYVFSFIYAINKIKSINIGDRSNNRKLVVRLIIAFFITQIIQFIFPWTLSEYVLNAHFDKSDAYYSFLNGDHSMAITIIRYNI